MSLPFEIFYVAALAAAPISEVRGALPVALHVFHMPLAEAIATAFLGNLAAAALVAYSLGPIMRLLARRIPFVHKFADIWLVRAREKVRKEVEKYGVAGLILFIGIPLPLTGAWTGAAGGILLGMTRRKVLIASAAGIIVSAAIVLAVDFGIIKLIF